MTIKRYTGGAGSAWMYDLPAIFQQMKVDQGETGLVAAWAIHCPHAHPLWSYYRLTLVHLRPLPNVSEPLIYLPGATHELLLFTLNPDSPPTEDVIPMNILLHANFAAQLNMLEGETDQIVPTDYLDQKAIKLIEERAILPMVQGRLSPDTDYSSQWIKAFNDSMVRK